MRNDGFKGGMEVTLKNKPFSGLLFCPVCGKREGLYPGAVRIASRPAEWGLTQWLDVETGYGGIGEAKVVETLAFPRPDAQQAQHSRGGIYIAFSCTTCGPFGYLNVERSEPEWLRHPSEGTTLVTWTMFDDETRAYLHTLADIRDALTYGTEIQPD